MHRGDLRERARRVQQEVPVDATADGLQWLRNVRGCHSQRRVDLCPGRDRHSLLTMRHDRGLRAWIPMRPDGNGANNRLQMPADLRW